VSSLVLLPASFAILLAGVLLFTNAIEWFGSRLGLGQAPSGAFSMRSPRHARNL
jgi:hypothetical protein